MTFKFFDTVLSRSGKLNFDIILFVKNQSRKKSEQNAEVVKFDIYEAK